VGTDKMLTTRFYQNLGKLFYAMAAIDNTVRSEELNQLIVMVKNEWLTSNDIEESFKTNAEDAIVNTFKWLHNDKEYDAEVCYNSFLAFKKENEQLFTPHINKLILKTAQAIASAFSGVNKSELILLTKLNLELNK